jgi:hypothetical protein
MHADRDSLPRKLDSAGAALSVHIDFFDKWTTQHSAGVLNERLRRRIDDVSVTLVGLVVVIAKSSGRFSWTFWRSALE